MELKDKINELREEILMRFRMFPGCYIHNMSTPDTEAIICTLKPLFSYIEFDKEDLTSPIISIIIDNVEYFAQVIIPFKELARGYLFEIKRAKSIGDFLSIIEDLLSYKTKAEYVTITIYKTESIELDFTVIGKGVIEFELTLYEDKNVRERSIIFDNREKKLIYVTHINYVPIIYHELSLADNPKVYMSLREYAMKISNFEEFTRFENAVKELIKLVKRKGYSVEDAVKELIEKHGYWDMFGQY